MKAFYLMCSNQSSSSPSIKESRLYMIQKMLMAMTGVYNLVNSCPCPMIELFAVLSTGGLVLWSYERAKAPGVSSSQSPFSYESTLIDEAFKQQNYRPNPSLLSVLDALIDKVFCNPLQQVSKETLGDQLGIGHLMLKWRIRDHVIVFNDCDKENEHKDTLPSSVLYRDPLTNEPQKLVFVIGWTRMLPAPPFVDDLLMTVMKEFLVENPWKAVSFDDRFAEILDDLETKTKESKSERHQIISKNNAALTKTSSYGEKTSRAQIETLDYSSKVNTSQLIKKRVNTPSLSINSRDDTSLSTSSSINLFSKLFGNLLGNKSLTKSDLQSSLSALRSHLLNKNVAVECVGHLVDKVASRLEGTQTGTLQTIQGLVREALRSAIQELMNVNSRDINLRDEIGAKYKMVIDAPFLIIFVGVNGVGKSTSLAKVAYYCRDHGPILVIAGDTFRSGAIEQLRIHVRRLRQEHHLDIDLYERGYGKETLQLTQEALAKSDKKYKLVLVDTAGRMQENVPLMKSLGQLVQTIDPDKVFFVGEALVGNEAVNQLKKFNQHLKSGDHGKGLDGIILTKFDTVDDKVGAAVSMVAASGVSLAFLGVGQGYEDLKIPDLDQIVSTLLR